ncbi:HNH endonuclease [Mycobacterium phage Patience]|uniref:HNH endonuclease n=1 Tax=Mycobacterium phage Patience TaxID=1074308 RepID=G1JWB6_9CAUD|nr:HNH endonuclease [Mycobacterium phage Patience]AEL97914.1 hypothetical protein PATIENCE_5 [Mycobacterium phage Patience]UOW93331.1 HNH endonuclease [Mycobacterium phage Labelle]
MKKVETATRVCKRCNQRKPFSDFHKNRSGYKTKCKDCCSEIASNYWGKNKEILRKKADERAKLIKIPNQTFVSQVLKNSCCADCGEDNWLVLQFDHVRGEKYRNVSDMMNTHSLEAVAEEVAKCDIVCSNCHILRTMKTSNSWRLQYVDV